MRFSAREKNAGMYSESEAGFIGRLGWFLRKVWVEKAWKAPKRRETHGLVWAGPRWLGLASKSFIRP